MSTFSAKGSDIDVEAVMANIRKRIEEKRKGLYTEEEIREIAEMKLDAVLDPSEFNSDFVSAFRARDRQWNFTFSPETIYASSRGGTGSIIRLARKVLNPLLKLFFNPNPVISALSRQADLNRYYVLLLHNIALEMTKMNLELTHLKARLRAMGVRVDVQGRREKVLEELAVPKTGGASGGEGAQRRRPRGGRRPWRRRRGGRGEGEDRRQNASEGRGGNEEGNRGGQASA